jgi:dephospho-CoA kinase
MLRVGITGGIGSGKSVVSRIFEVLGVPVYYADTEAKRLMNTDGELKTKLRAVFGEEVYRDGMLNRSWLAARVFQHEEKLKLLNSIVHPAVIAHGLRWMASQSYPYALKEAALVFESGSASELDYVIGVYAPQPLRLQRVMLRDKADRNDVLARMSKQINEEMKMKLCDFVIYNDEQQLVTPQVIQLHQKLLKEAASR